MVYVLLALGAAFSASAVWLVVRSINRRERWAKWALAMLIGLPSPYVLNFGPAYWMSDRGYISPVDIGEAYQPMTRAMVAFPDTVGATMRTFIRYGWFTPLIITQRCTFWFSTNCCGRDVTPESR